MKERVRRTISFWRAQGTGAIVQLVFRKLGAVATGRPLFNPLNVVIPVGMEQPDWEPGPKSVDRPVTVLQIADAVFPALRALKTFPVPSADRRRVTIVTDSVSKGSLFGGVGTALLFAGQLANRLDANLRIVTRLQKAPPENVAQVFSVYGLSLKHEMQFLFAAVDDRMQEVDMYPDELFLTTSWWTTAATLPSVPAANIVYLLQEDERMFYPYGDERLKCEQIMGNREIRFLINTQLLFDHLVAAGLDNIGERALWFEPAFPATVFHPREQMHGQKKRFFFYARPENHRNLFQLGIAVVDRVIQSGVLNPRDWDLYFVGAHIPQMVFGEDWTPIRCENLSWAEYAELVGSIDLALSLMCTPHPSYPPLDLAASGAVVVTTRFANKVDLSGYSENILCADMTAPALADALARAVLLVESPQRRVQFERNGMGQSWEKSFAHVLDALAGG